MAYFHYKKLKIPILLRELFHNFTQIFKQLIKANDTIHPTPFLGGLAGITGANGVAGINKGLIGVSRN